jgi:biopolymer transport protein ExbD
MAFTTGGGAIRAEMNITPMIDILLVLIVVFMVVVSMSTETGLNAQIPQPATDRPQKADAPIVIQVEMSADKKEPALKINSQAVGWPKLHDRLLEILKLRAERVAFVKGDGDIDFQYVADAIAIAHDSGVSRIGLLTQNGMERR